MPGGRRPRPRPWRLALAFFLAPPAAATAIVGGLAVFSGLSDMAAGRVATPSAGETLVTAFVMLFYAFPIAYALAFLAGVPLYFWLVDRVSFRLRGPVLAGCGVTLPFLAVLAIEAASAPRWDGWWIGDLVAASAAALALVLGGGAFGGLVFWIAAAWRDPRLRHGAG